MRMKFTCQPLATVPVSATAYGPCAQFDGQRLQNADRQSIDCGTNKYLAAIFMQRSGCGGGQQRIQATCNTSPNWAKSGCITRYGDSSASINGQTDEYFDRLDFFCSGGEAMQSLNLGRSGNTFQYRAKCCK